MASSTTAAITSTTTDASSTNPCFNPNLQPHVQHLIISIKFDTTNNHSLWKAQFEPPVPIAYDDFLKFVDGSSTCPSKLASDYGTPNPAYLQYWVRQDQIMFFAPKIENNDLPSHTTHNVEISSLRSYTLTSSEIKNSCKLRSLRQNGLVGIVNEHYEEGDVVWCHVSSLPPLGNSTQIPIQIVMEETPN